jgi:hypothetical protein
MLIFLTQVYVETGREANIEDVLRDFMHVCQPNISLWRHSVWMRQTDRQTDRHTSSIPIRCLRSTQFIRQPYSSVTLRHCSHCRSPQPAHYGFRCDKIHVRQNVTLSSINLCALRQATFGSVYVMVQMHIAHRHTMCTERLPIWRSYRTSVRFQNNGQRPEIQSLTGTRPIALVVPNIQT